jgi:hypothetical protein
VLTFSNLRNCVEAGHFDTPQRDRTR